MKFEPGHPKIGGRQAGTPNRSALARIQEQFPGFDPLLEMVKMVRDPETSPELKKSLLSEIITYTTPRLKPVELMEFRRLTEEAVLALAAGEGDPIDTFIAAFLEGRLSAQDLSSLVAALSLKQKPQGQGGIDEQAELLRLIKG